MRVTNRASTRNYLRYVNKGLSDQAKVQERVASGNRFEKVSDDVSSGIQAMKARTEQYKMEKQIGNIEDINNILVAAEDSMQSIDDQLKTVHARFLRAMNDTNINNRNIFAAEIKALKQEILQLANASYNGQYLFSGSNNYDAPFSVDPTTGHLVYNGIGVPVDEIYQREDGTYYYGTVQYDENGNPITKNIPATNAGGQYLFEGGNAKQTPTTATLKTGDMMSDGKPVAAAGTGIYKDTTTGSGTFYVSNPNEDYTYLKVDTTTSSLGALSDNGDGTFDINGTTVVKRSDNVYEAENGTLYVKDPRGGTDFFAAESTQGTEKEGANLALTTDANGKITVTNVAGQTVELTKTGEGTYEDADGTLFVVNEWGTGVKQVQNVLDENGNPAQQNVPAFKDVPLNEEIYLDVGLGIRMNGSTVDPQTAFNVSYCGPEILGFGINEENGLSNNIYNLLNDMEEMLKDPSKYSVDQAQAFGDQLLNRLDAFRENVTDLGAKTQFLETMLDRLNKQRDNLEISIGNYTGTDYVEESRHQASASAVVNALYQLGSNIIPLSLMDFVD